MRSLRQIEPDVHFTEEATLDALGQTLARPRIEAVLQSLGVREQRTRKLTMVLTVLLCITMSLYTEEAIDDVLRKLLQGPRFLRPDDDLEPASAAAICQRRRQLGVAPLETLFHAVCRPLATPETQDAFLFGLRLMAIDGTTEDVPDTAVNVAHFGRARGSRGDSAFPLVKAVYLCECGTHAICDAVFQPYAVSERAGGLQLLRSLTPAMLAMWDRGFHSFDMCNQCCARGAHFLARASTALKLTPRQVLSDGSYLAELRPSQYKRRQRGEQLLVRVIEYTIDDPVRPGHGLRHRVLTSLLDAVAYPAKQLASAYHERWEIEITIDETDTHQRRPRQPLRSRTPAGVTQELYGLLLAHYAVRSVMHAAALRAQVAPDRLSFVHALRIVRQAVFEFQIIAPDQQPAWYERLVRDIGRQQLPARDLRCNPRVVKRKMSNFTLKRDIHRHVPQPTKPFADAIVILI